MLLKIFRETPIVSLDCEMVEVDRSGDGLARYFIVPNLNCSIIEFQ